MAALRRLGFSLVLVGLVLLGGVAILALAGSSPGSEDSGIPLSLDLDGTGSVDRVKGFNSEQLPVDDPVVGGPVDEGGWTVGEGDGPPAAETDDPAEADGEPDTNAEPKTDGDPESEAGPSTTVVGSTDPTPVTEAPDRRPNRSIAPGAAIVPAPVDVGVRQATGTDLFVDPINGSDDGTGTSEAEAWASLGTALRRVEAGQTINLMTGDYAETMAPGAAHYLLDRDGTAQDWIRITAAPGHRPVLVGTALPALEVRGDYVEVSGLTIQGWGYDAENSWGVGLVARGGHHVVFATNDVSGFALAGINAIETSDISIVGNRVWGNAFYSPNQGSGISVWRSKHHEGDTGQNRIIANVVYENENKVESGFWPGLRTDGNGIIVDEARHHDYRGSFLVANNLVVNNGGRAIHIWKSDNVDVVHNTTYHNAWSENLNGKAELSAGHSSGLRFLNNLVWADMADGIPAVNVDIDPRTGRSTADVVSAGNLLVTERRSVAIGPDDRVTDQIPQLVNPGISPATMDFRPRSDSMAVDSARQLGPTPSGDFLGNPRQGTADIGAYEFSG